VPSASASPDCPNCFQRTPRQPAQATPTTWFTITGRETRTSTRSHTTIGTFFQHAVALTLPEDIIAALGAIDESMTAFEFELKLRDLLDGRASLSVHPPSADRPAALTDLSAGGVRVCTTATARRRRIL
jgi:hypothetical protein